MLLAAYVTNIALRMMTRRLENLLKLKTQLTCVHRRLLLSVGANMGRDSWG